MATTAKTKCMGWTSRRDFRNNLPCGNNAQPGKEYCKIHDPELIAKRDEERMKRFNDMLHRRDRGDAELIEQLNKAEVK